MTTTEQIIRESKDPTLVAYLAGTMEVLCGLIEGLPEETAKDLIRYLDATIVEQNNERSRSDLWILHQLKTYVELKS